MYKIYYTEKINKVGWFGIPYTVLKLRSANVDAKNYRRLHGRPFSLAELLRGACAEE
ncbi:MAG: hypothetical protein IJ124_10945 [Clostridia bacterium]|nr:hypothetical protein [Clostridia bacterium]